MVARMPLCDRRQLELALADMLLPAQAENLSEHLQGCSHCRAELEQLAGAGPWWSEAKTYLSSSDELVAVDDDGLACGAAVSAARGGQSSLDASDLPGRAGETPAPQDDDIPPLDFLALSEQPGMLGRLGSYEIEEIVGRGGMGIVLKARDPALDRVVAIKVLAGHLSASAAARKRFAYEARAAAAVVHDHVIPIHAVDTSGQTPFLVMPFVTGRSLQDRLDACGTLETKEVLRIALQTAEGLAAAHAQGLVHRDIKPANILLENGCERVRITDFGLARAVDDASQTQSGFIAGTPQYMAPEQARGEAIDARADLFSLGSVMYAMCTGRPPFRAETTLAVLRRICDEQPRDVREVNPDVPIWLAAIIEKLLAKSPADRFQTAAEVAGLLRDWLAHVAQPTVIRAPAVVALASKRRPRADWQPWAIGIAAATIVVLGGFWAIWQAGQAGPAGAAGPGGATQPSTASAPPEGQIPLAVQVPPGRRDLQTTALRASDQAFQTELATAWEETSYLETSSLAGDQRSIADELAELDARVNALEQELTPPRRSERPLSPR